MEKLKEILCKAANIGFEILITYMLLVLFEIAVAFMFDEPKIFIPTLIICAVFVFINRFKKRKLL